MSGEVIPVLWVCGPPGVGKTTVGWEIYAQLIRSGIAVGYIDIDQLGICYPEPMSDPGRHRLKAGNLGAVRCVDVLPSTCRLAMAAARVGPWPASPR